MKTDNANVVADLAVKPTSIYTFAEIEDAPALRFAICRAPPRSDTWTTTRSSAPSSMVREGMRAGVLAKAWRRQLVAGTGWVDSSASR